jgi:hypothetical protein
MRTLVLEDHSYSRRVFSYVVPNPTNGWEVLWVLWVGDPISTTSYQLIVSTYPTAYVIWCSFVSTP